MKINRTTVESSNIKSIGWADNVLEVEFKHGAVYQYDGVSQHEFNELMLSNSKGQYLNAHIKSKYNFKKLEAADA